MSRRRTGFPTSGLSADFSTTTLSIASLELRCVLMIIAQRNLFKSNTIVECLASNCSNRQKVKFSRFWDQVILNSKPNKQLSQWIVSPSRRKCWSLVWSLHSTLFVALEVKIKQMKSRLIINSLGSVFITTFNLFVSSSRCLPTTTTQSPYFALVIYSPNAPGTNVVLSRETFCGWLPIKRKCFSRFPLHFHVDDVKGESVDSWALYSLLNK